MMQRRFDRGSVKPKPGPRKHGRQNSDMPRNGSTGHRFACNDGKRHALSESAIGRCLEGADADPGTI
jgi:hypothetical protein